VVQESILISYYLSYSHLKKMWVMISHAMEKGEQSLPRENFPSPPGGEGIKGRG
jgi:hypothetical protein